MKRKTTKEILAESFRELAEGKSVDKITVQEIVDNCDYSTATFYRHFKDKYDLIAWNYARKTAEIMGRINGEDYSWTQTLRDGARHYNVEKEYLANLLLHTSGHDAFIQYMADINYGELEKHILSVSGLRTLDEKTAMLEYDCKDAAEALPMMSKALALFEDDYVSRSMIQEFIVD